MRHLSIIKVEEQSEWSCSHSGEKSGNIGHSLHCELGYAF